MLDAHRIAPKLWQGSRPREGTVLASRGFDVVVLVAKEHQPRSHRFPGLRAVVHAGIGDGVLTADEWDAASEAASIAASHAAKGHRVLVTCNMGVNRSGLVNALALHRLTGWSGAECIAAVRRGRGIVRVHGKELLPLSNPSFEQALRRLPARRRAA